MKTKKSKRHKKVCHKGKLEFEDYKNCSEAQIGNNLNHWKKIDINSLNEDHKKFTKNNKLILETQQRF